MVIPTKGCQTLTKGYNISKSQHSQLEGTAPFLTSSLAQQLLQNSKSCPLSIWKAGSPHTVVTSQNNLALMGIKSVSQTDNQAHCHHSINAPQKYLATNGSIWFKVIFNNMKQLPTSKLRCYKWKLGNIRCSIYSTLLDDQRLNKSPLWNILCYRNRITVLHCQISHWVLWPWTEARTQW